MSQQIQKRAEQPIMDMLKKYKVQIEGVIPNHMTPDRMMRLVVGAFNQTPKLLGCAPLSLVNAVVTAASLGLEIRPRSAYLVPYGSQCQLLIDYRGKIDLAMRSGKVGSINTQIVHAHDQFDLVFTDKETSLTHRPLVCKKSGHAMEPIPEKERGEVILVYSVAKLKGGDPVLEYMTFDQIEGIRNRARAGKDGPWVTDWEQMARKTVIHRICNYLPMSPELAASQDVDDAYETGRPLPPAFEFDAADLNQGPIIEQSEEKAGQVAEAKAKAAAVKQNPKKAPAPSPELSREPGDDVDEEEEPESDPQPTQQEQPQRQANISTRPDPRLVFPGRS